jgi:RNA polymerase-binding protein DksA
VQAKKARVSPGNVAKEDRPRTGAAAAPRKALGKAQKQELLSMLLEMRERLGGQVAALKGDSLKREDGVNSAEDGTDAFERQFALNIASSEHNSLVEIEEALRRLNEGTYGICEECANVIEMPRLKALPFVSKCIGCQSKTENGRAKSRAAVLLDKL